MAQMAFKHRLRAVMFWLRNCHKGTQKVLQIVFRDADMTRGCSKLGKTRIIEDADIRMARNAAFLIRDFHLHSIEIEGADLLSYYFIIFPEAATKRQPLRLKLA